MPDKPKLTDPNVLPLAASDDATSLSLLERVKKQDGSAWRRLEQLYGPLVLRWCKFMGLQDADTADMCQEVFLAVHLKIGEFRREPPEKTFRKWLRTIARNEIIDRWRRNRRQPEAVGGSEAQAVLNEWPAETPEEETAVEEEKSLLMRRALELLQTDFRPETWKAFWRTWIDDVSPKEIAAELQVSLGAVYTARSRVRRRLKQEFGDLLDL